MTLLLRRQDQRHECADPVDHSPEVDIDDPVPVLQRQLPRETPRHDSCVVDSNMELPEAIHDGPPDTLHRVGVADIDGHRVHLGARLAQSVGMDAKPVPVQVGHHHPHAQAHKGLAYGKTDPARGAGDHRNPVSQLVHHPILPWRPAAHRSPPLVSTSSTPATGHALHTLTSQRLIYREFTFRSHTFKLPFPEGGAIMSGTTPRGGRSPYAAE